VGIFARIFAHFAKRLQDTETTHSVRQAKMFLSPVMQKMRPNTRKIDLCVPETKIWKSN